jgi:hypothetical protein
MLLYRIKYCLFLIIILFPTGCETNVENVNLPEFKQKLVITSFISPSDTVTYITVRSNMKLFGELNTEEPLGNLTGSISDGLNEVALDTFKTGLKIDHSKMQIQYGKTYRLNVSSENGLSAEAYCTVPEKINFSIKADTFSIPTSFEWEIEKRRIDIKLTIQDIPGIENFYRFSLLGRVYQTDPNTNKTVAYDNYINFDNDLITDKGMDGKEIIQKSNYGINYFFNAGDSCLLVVYLYNLEKSYYLYHKSLRDYSGGDNPFSEATPVYSNVTGGLGVFSSYTVDSLILRIK